MDENKNIINDDQMNELVNTLEEETPDEVKNMKESIANTSDVESEGNDEGYCEEIKDISLDSSYEELLGGSVNELGEADISLFDINDEDSTALKLSDEDVNNRIKDNLSAIMNIPEVEMLSFCSLISRYRKDRNSVTNVYSELPQSFKDNIAAIAVEQHIPFTEYNKMARLFMDEIVSQAEMDEVFVDIEKSLNEALKIPTIADMYSEHTREVMDVKIPEIIEKIKDTEPENAKLLGEVRDVFHTAYSLNEMKNHYNENTRTRKFMRREFDYNNPIKFCDEFNLKNSRSKFKMPDCRSIGPALCRVFINEIPEEGSRIEKMNITMDDLNKFVVLFCRHCMDMNSDKLLDAAYMYYSLKNITMLNLTNETKTPFAVELINNICDIIEFVREKEAEFNASGKSNKRKKKNIR